MSAVRTYMDTIVDMINNGHYVFIKCGDDSEKFMHKFNDVYCISLFSDFKSVLSSRRDDIDIRRTLEGIRGYGVYTPDDSVKYEYTLQVCGCDS